VTSLKQNKGMFQPFEIMKPQYINKLISLKKVYLVSQTYKRNIDHFFNEGKVSILLTDYDDAGLSKIHLSAVKNDKYASVINLSNEEHLLKIKEMLAEDSKYNVYWSIVKDLDAVKKRVDLKYKDNIRRYVLKETTWRIGGDEKIRPQLQVIFGELFVILKRGSQELRVKFEDIEKS